ncbi:uncharacterized protein TNCV_4617681 [Trichonephila clavipes]|nr:uncharacterized protein TNCV_4617681 [Trichonephila clavipes]
MKMDTTAFEFLRCISNVDPPRVSTIAVDKWLCGREFVARVVSVLSKKYLVKLNVEAVTTAENERVFMRINTLEKNQIRLMLTAKKLCKENYLDKEVRNSNQSNGYRMINIDILLSELYKYLIRPNCNTKAVLKEKILYGLVSEFYVECNSCSILTTFKSSSVIASTMDLPPPVSQKSYERILRKINMASREVADDSMKNAAKEEVSASGSNEICVSGDVTWKTRGHTSRIGVCTLVCKN